MMANAGIWMGMILLAFAGLLFQQSLTYDYYSGVLPGPGLFPLWLTGILAVLAIFYIIDCYRNGSISVKDILPKGEGMKKVLVLMGTLIFVIVATPYIGYILSTMIMLYFLFALSYKWHSSLLISVVITLITYYVFKKFLSVPLPTGFLGF